ncbi:hypothetical protein P153DRAFT_294915 [Dothidotthia symphoricarpi CBS 119687]|uniref:N-acetyltransferase domain-containing protein n=1 Tax=Dothidotthia symphoricarpi CBS 119687 TaxID=1392245 RepID=A0A6A6A782_9PLEO|nr:uncharacterized protein P153DRAFT_294915 [Dothidotthia symphoricarpi CBS 119687]KAF2127680.1 hypothetical protein P153DRAFT_294915 [Dothidotthia symphoricarpi CBS 119687]
MPVRLAQPSEESAIVSVCTAAFFNEELFGVTIHPHRHEYPEDMRIFWHDWVRNDWKNPRVRILVTTAMEEGQEKISGVAIWERQGSDEGAKKVQEEWTDPCDVFLPLPSTENRALDPTKRTILQDSYPYFAHHWDGPRANNWYLSLCCIDPAFQKRGFGYELVDWGVKKAREENVHASVIASHENEKFYLRCGFDEIVGNGCEGEGNPLGIANVKGGDILFMWPKEAGKE